MKTFFGTRNGKLLTIAAVIIIIALGAGAWYYTHRTPAVPQFPINAADTISSWEFQGTYTGNADLEQKTTADETKLKGLLGTGQYDDYDVYLGLGNDENLLGHGKTAYEYYNHSIAIHPNKGLAYMNLAHLMAELGAYETAADAYKKAVTVEPRVITYHAERLNYLTQQFPNDTARIEAAYQDSYKQFGDVAQILSIKAQWLADQGKYADAITAWQKVKQISPGRDMTAVDAEIARLKAKESRQ